MCDPSAEQQRDGLTGRQEQGIGSMPPWPALQVQVVAVGRIQGVPCIGAGV